MRILVSGTGRSGTCLLIEIIRGFGIVDISQSVEDRKFFKYKELPENYGTKLVTEHKTFTLKNIESYIKKYKDLQLFFSLRHPLDIYLSKIRRGQKASQGGDRPGEWIADDGTHGTALETIKDFYLKYRALKTYYHSRIFSAKLEDLILSPKKTVREIAKDLGVKATQKAMEFWKYDRNKYHKKRYGKTLDRSQIGLWERWDTIYEGFFRDKKADIDKAKRELNLIVEDLGYRL